jgi:hypothetical protein
MHRELYLAPLYLGCMAGALSVGRRQASKYDSPCGPALTKEAGVTATQLKELYEETVASQLKVWDDEIEHLDARADIIMAQVEDRYYCLLRSLRAKEKEVRVRLEQLREAGDDCWEDLKADLLTQTEDMKAALGHAVEEIDPVRA